MTASGEEATAVEPGAAPEATVEREGETNVGWPGRLSSTAIGATMVGYGLSNRRSLRGAASTAVGGWLVYRGVSGHCSAFEAAGVDTARRQRPRLEPGASPHAQSVERSITVLQSPDEIQEYWIDPEILSQIAGPGVDVTWAGEDRIRWTVDAPFGRTRSWQLQLAEERPGELVRWESTEGALVPSEATVRFEPAPADRGTEVHLEVRWDPPGGRFGAAVLERLGVVPASFLTRALRRAKSIAETGEPPTLEGNPSARGAGDLL